MFSRESMWSRRSRLNGWLCECAMDLPLECLVRGSLGFGSKSRRVFEKRGSRPLFRYLWGNDEGVGMGGEASSESGAQSKELDDHSDLTRRDKDLMRLLVAYLSARSGAARCLRKDKRCNKLQEQAREDRKRCQLSSDVRVHSRRRHSLVVSPVIGFRCARRATATASSILVN